MKAWLAALSLLGVFAVGADALANDRYWDRENFRGARNAYQKDLEARRDFDRRFDRDDNFRKRRHFRPPNVIIFPGVIFPGSPRVIFVDPVVPIEAVPISPPFVDEFGRSCREVRLSRGYGVACLYSDGYWRLVS